MPKYDVDIAGKTYEVDAPDENTAWQWANYTHQQEPPPPPPKSGMLNEFKRGSARLFSSSGAGIEGTGSQEDATAAGLKELAAQKEQQATYGDDPLTKVKKAYEERGFFPAAGEFVRGMPEAIAQMAPQLAANAGGAWAGARIGAMTPVPGGALIGGVLGAGAAMLPGISGSNFAAQAGAAEEKGVPFEADRGAAYSAAAAQAALEGAGQVLTLGTGIVSRILRIAPKDVTKLGATAQAKLVHEAQQSLWATTGKGALRAGGAEVPVEVAQQILERAQAGQSLTDESALQSYGDAALGALQAAPAMGAAGNVVTRSDARGQVRAIEGIKKMQAEAQQAQQEAETARLAKEEAARTEERDVPGFAHTAEGSAEDAGETIPTPAIARALAQAQQDMTAALQRATDAAKTGDFDGAKAAQDEAAQHASIVRTLTPLKTDEPAPPRQMSVPEMQQRLKQLQGTDKTKGLYANALRTDARDVADAHLAEMRDLHGKLAAEEHRTRGNSEAQSRLSELDAEEARGLQQTQEDSADVAAQMAAGREEAQARSKLVADEKARLQTIADNAKQPSEAQAVKNALAKDVRDATKTEPVYAQQDLLGTAETPATRSDAKLEDAVGKLTETVVDPHAIDLEKQIGDLEDARDQAKSAGREGDAATYQARIVGLQSRGRVNLRNADIAERVDTLHKQLEKAKNDAESARSARGVGKAEAANKTARDIADQMAQLQQEPGSIAGRLIKAKNDTSSSLAAFFDAAHEINTAGTESRLREKQTYLRSVLNDMRNRGAVNDRLGEGQMHVSITDVTRQLRAIEAQIGALGFGESPKMVAARARQAITKYVRAAFREENIRREARNQQPLEGAAREAFAKHAEKQAESILTRVMADRGGDYMEEHVVQPAVMRSGKVIRGAVTEFRDSRALKDRPYAKFSRAREVEEEAFHEQRAKLQHKSIATRVESGLLKRQWQATDAKNVSEDRGEGAKTMQGQKRRRAEYLMDKLDSLELANIQAQGVKDYVVGPMREALEKYPVNGVMEAVEKLLYEAQTGRMPSGKDMDVLHEAVALENRVAEERYDEGAPSSPQRTLLDDTALQHTERVKEINARIAKLENSRRNLPPETSAQIDRLTDRLEALLTAGKKDSPEVQSLHKQLKKLGDNADYRELRALEAEKAAILQTRETGASTSFERTTPARFQKAPEVKKGRAAGDQALREQHDTHSMLLRESERAPTAGEQSMSVYEAGLRRREKTVLDAENQRKLDAALEERAQMEEMERRLSKLPHTRQTKNAESAMARLMHTALRKEAAGLEVMVKQAYEKGSSDAYIRKLENLLTKANLNYEQIEAFVPVKIERSYDAQTSEADEVWVGDIEYAQRQLNKIKALQKEAPNEEVAAQLAEDHEKAQDALDAALGGRKDSTHELYRRPSGKATKEAVSAAEKLEMMNKGRGRGRLVVPVVGPRKIRNSGAARQVTTHQAVLDGNRIASDRAIKNVEKKIANIENLQRLLQERVAGTTKKAELTKYAAYEAKLAQEHASATATLNRMQPAEPAPVDVKQTKEQREASLDQEYGAEDTAKEFSDTGTLASVETRQALRDGDVQGTIDGLIRDGSTPEVRALAEKLKPFLEGVQIGTDLNVKHEGKSVAGLYEESRNKITMHPDRLTEEDILHELTHAATATVMNTPDANLAPHVRAAKQAVITLWESMRNSPTFFAGEYANVSAKEFASEVFSNPSLRNKMDNVGEPKTLWQRFVTAIARMFGGGRTASEKALAQIEQILSPAQVHFRGEDTAKTVVDTLSEQLYAPKTTALERMTKNFGMRFEQAFVDMRAPLDQALKAGKGDAAAQAMYFMRKADARMSHVYAVLSEGALKLVRGAKGHLIIEAGNSASAKDLFTAVGKLKGANTEQKMAIADLYMKAIRAKRVGVAKMDLGKTTEAQLNALLKEVDSDPEQKVAMEEVRRVYNDYNRGMIEFLADSGAIPRALAKELMKHGDYVPYYRVNGNIGEFMFDEEHPITIGDLRHQKYLQELKGDDAKFLPLNEAIMRNTLLLTDMAMRNIASKSVAYALQDIGRGKGPVNAKTGKATNLMGIARGYGDDRNGTTVRFNQEPDPAVPEDDGKRHIKIQTEGTAAEFIPSGMLAQSIEGMSVTLPSFLKGAGWFSDVLRSGITRNPMYVLRQLVRDPWSASFTAGLDTKPLTAIAKSMAEFGRQMSGHSPTAAALIRKGVLQSQIFNGSPSDLTKMSLQIAGGNNEGIHRLFAFADKAAIAADSATRAQIYDSVIRRGGSEMEAEMAAIEMMNFHKRGGSPGALYASRMIPFFNAQIQGLNVLVKAASGKATMEDTLQIREKFIHRAMGLAAFTVAYAAAMSDNEEYKNARPRDRYGNFFIPLPNGTTIKAPIPFEVGLLFKALPEAFVDYLRGEFNEEEWEAVRHMLISSIPGASSWGMPQAIKPLVEVVANHDFYTGNPIESAGMERLTPDMRFNANTTELAKQLSSETGGVLSPVKLEKLVTGYLGSLPIAIAALANEIFNTSGIERPERKLTELPVFGSMFQDSNGGGATDAMYAKIKALNEAKASAKKLEEMGDMKRVEALHKEVIDTLTGAVSEEAEKTLHELSKTEREIRLSDLTPARKREELDRVAADRTREMQRYLKITRDATSPA